MSEQNTGWRDISTAPLDGTVVLVREKDGCVYSANFCPVEESWKLADQDGMRWNDDLELVAHWKPLPPPPGEEVEDWYALGVKDGRDGCLVELDALQARCDKLEAAASTLLAHLVAAVSVIKTSEENGNHPSCAYGSDTMYRMAMKDFDRCMEAGRDALQARCDKLEAERNQVIQELLEKAEGECRQDPETGIRGQRRPGEDPVTYGVRLRDAEGAVDWLKSQMEGE